MDWSAGLGWVLIAAFGVGALHALEPGHGKSIMGAYLVASRGGIRHAILLGLMVTITHTFVVFLLAIAALRFAAGQANPSVTFWLEIVSAALVLAVGVWMILASFRLLRRRQGHHSQDHAHEHSSHGHDHQEGHQHEHGQGHGHAHPHPHPHPHPHAQEHDQEHQDDHEHHGHSHKVKIPEGKNPLGFWTLMAVGASGGLVPCPAAITALLAAINIGRTAEGVAVVGSMSLGIGATLIAIGILFVQAGRLASKLFGAHGLMSHAPRVSAIVVTLLGCGLLARALIGHAHY